MRILCEAIRLFGRKGFTSTSVREVVEAAGCTKPTLYYYFANKDALFSEAVSAQLDGFRTLVDSVIHAEGSARSRLCSFLHTYVHGGIQHPESVRLMVTATAPMDDSQPRIETIERFRAELGRLGIVFDQGIAEGELRAGVDASTAITLIVGAADITLMSGLAGAPVPDDFADRIVSTLWEGLSR
ncbi:MAG: TetR/AcrR family transcriptional regulator [Myxococcota bacterium]